jgi:hypothetical protein
MAQTVAYIFQNYGRKSEKARVAQMRKSGMWFPNRVLELAGVLLAGLTIKGIGGDGAGGVDAAGAAGDDALLLQALAPLLSQLRAARQQSAELRSPEHSIGEKVLFGDEADSGSGEGGSSGSSSIGVVLGLRGGGAGGVDGCRKIRIGTFSTSSNSGTLSAGEEVIRAAMVAAARTSCEGYIAFVIASKPSVCYLDNYLYYANGLAGSNSPWGGYPPLLVVVGDRVTMDACTRLVAHYTSLLLSCVKHLLYTDEFVPVSGLQV